MGYANSICALRFDLDIDHHSLANAGDRFSGWSKHQIEITARDRIGGHSPACPTSFINRRQQVHVKRDRLRHSVHSEVARNVATLRSCAFYAPASKCDPGKFLNIKEFGASQMIVALLDLRVDASHVNLRGDR